MVLGACVLVWGRALVNRWMRSEAQCDAGGALRPLRLPGWRGQARAVLLRRGWRRDMTARVGAVAALSVLASVVLLALGAGALDAPAIAQPAAGLVPPPAVVEVETVPPQSMIALRLVEPNPIPVTAGELYQALARSPWPRELWPQVVRIASCEARYGSAIDSVAEGDGGRALGVLQIRVDAHRELARDFDLLTIDGALGAAWMLFQRSGYSFAPWSCA
jgi:hypothetical protein